MPKLPVYFGAAAALSAAYYVTVEVLYKPRVSDLAQSDAIVAASARPRQRLEQDLLQLGGRVALTSSWVPPMQRDATLDPATCPRNPRLPLYAQPPGPFPQRNTEKKALQATLGFLTTVLFEDMCVSLPSSSSSASATSSRSGSCNAAGVRMVNSRNQVSGSNVEASAVGAGCFDGVPSAVAQSLVASVATAPTLFSKTATGTSKLGASSTSTSEGIEDAAENDRKASDAGGGCQTYFWPVPPAQRLRNVTHHDRVEYLRRIAHVTVSKLFIRVTEGPSRFMSAAHLCDQAMLPKRYGSQNVVVPPARFFQSPAADRFLSTQDEAKCDPKLPWVWVRPAMSSSSRAAAKTPAIEEAVLQEQEGLLSSATESTTAAHVSKLQQQMTSAGFEEMLLVPFLRFRQALTSFESLRSYVAFVIYRLFFRNTSTAPQLLALHSAEKEGGSANGDKMKKVGAIAARHPSWHRLRQQLARAVLRHLLEIETEMTIVKGDEGDDEEGGEEEDGGSVADLPLVFVPSCWVEELAFFASAANNTATAAAPLICCPPAPPSAVFSWILALLTDNTSSSLHISSSRSTGDCRSPSPSSLVRRDLWPSAALDITSALPHPFESFASLPIPHFKRHGSTNSTNTNTPHWIDPQQAAIDDALMAAASFRFRPVVCSGLEAVLHLPNTGSRFALPDVAFRPQSTDRYTALATLQTADTDGHVWVDDPVKRAQLEERNIGAQVGKKSSSSKKKAARVEAGEKDEQLQKGSLLEALIWKPQIDAAGGTEAAVALGMADDDKPVMTATANNAMSPVSSGGVDWRGVLDRHHHHALSHVTARSIFGGCDPLQTITTTSSSSSTIPKKMKTLSFLVMPPEAPAVSVQVSNTTSSTDSSTSSFVSIQFFTFAHLKSIFQGRLLLNNKMTEATSNRSGEAGETFQSKFL